MFDDARQYLEAARDAGLRRVVVSSSANTKDVLHVTGLDQFVEGRVDGVTINEKHSARQAGAGFVPRGRTNAGVAPEQAAVFEDALSGVQAGRAGNFGYVVGVNRLDDGARERAEEQRRVRRRRQLTIWTELL